MLKPDEFFCILSDETRLRCLLLLQSKGECCVCDLSYALQTIQPKISRHLTILRGAGIVSNRRAGAWVYYSIHPNLPAWAARMLSAVGNEISKFYILDLTRFDKRDRKPCIMPLKEISQEGNLARNPE